LRACDRAKDRFAVTAFRYVCCAEIAVIPDGVLTRRLTGFHAALGRIVRELFAPQALTARIDPKGNFGVRASTRLEADHGALKRLINPTRGFKTLPTASATIKGFEVMRMIRKRQCLMLESGAAGEVRFVNRLFRLAA